MSESFRLQPGNHRRQFADFLDRLATGSVESDEWASFAVTHYPDEAIEAIRRSAVRLQSLDLGPPPDSVEARKIILAWAESLRSFP